MKKGLVIVAFSFVVIYIIYKVVTFKLFDVEITKVQEIDVPNKSYKLGLFYLPSNATSQSYIQVKQLDNAEGVILKNYERYNFIKDYKVYNDTLRLILCDTIFNRPADTILLKLP